METKIKKNYLETPNPDSLKENTHLLQPSNFSNFLHTTPPQLHQTTKQSRSFLSTPHVPNITYQSNQPTKPTLNYTSNYNHFSSPIFLYTLTISAHTHSPCKWQPLQHQNYPKSNIKHHPHQYITSNKKSTHKPQNRHGQTITTKLQHTTTSTPNMITIPHHIPELFDKQINPSITDLLIHHINLPIYKS